MRRIFVGFIFIILSCQSLIGQEKEVDLIDLIREIQQWKKEDNSMKMVWWIPTKYWELSAKGNNLITEDAIDQIIESIKNYTIIAALDAEIGALGFNYNNSVSVKLIDNEGNEYKTLTNEEISVETKNLLNILKPTLANTIGQLGKNMNFYVFPYLKNNGKAITDPESKGSFTILFNKESFKWKLPLGSLVPQKTCPTDNEKLSGNWKFCPWHGTKLKE